MPPSQTSLLGGKEPGRKNCQCASQIPPGSGHKNNLEDSSPMCILHKERLSGCTKHGLGASDIISDKKKKSQKEKSNSNTDYHGLLIRAIVAPDLSESSDLGGKRNNPRVKPKGKQREAMLPVIQKMVPFLEFIEY